MPCPLGRRSGVKWDATAGKYSCPAVSCSSMQVVLAHIGARLPGGDEFNRLAEHYLQRTSPYAPAESKPFRSEEDFLTWLDRKQGRTPPVAVLLDSRGRQITSETFAAWIGERRDHGAQQMVFAIGPPSGWSETSRRRAELLLSLGSFTMPHALARVVLAEQLYRAFTILAGHPYHVGH